MAVSRLKTWVVEVLTASDLNAEFNNILNNAQDLANPATKTYDLDGNKFVLDGDGDTSITADTDDVIDIEIGGSDRIAADTGGLQGYQAKNFLVNGDFRIWQQGTSFTSATTPANSDDTYTADQWILLSDGNDRADITKETSVVPEAANAAMKFDVETVSGTSEKFGILQPIENEDALILAGKTVSLSFKARTTSGQVENLRAAVLAWDSTADVITSDVVSTWNAEGANPTFATNWTAENTATNLALTNAYTTYRVENISLDTASTTNLAVFIWVDDTDLTAGDVFYIADVQLNLGKTALGFERLRVAEQLDRCQRYYEKSYNDDVDPRTITAVGQVVHRMSATATFCHEMRTNFMTRKRTTPTVTWYSAVTGTSAKLSNTTDADDNDVSSTVGTGQTTTGYPVISVGEADNDILTGHWVAGARL